MQTQTKNTRYGSLYSTMSDRSIKWGKGSSFNINIGQINGWGAERYRTTENKWKFLITKNSGEWYQHFDDREFDTKEELDEAILEWMWSN